MRRSALERIGRFDPALGGAGDEEDWQRRLRAAGGRIRYVAAAGVDHRRAGADARVRGALARRVPPRPRRRAATTPTRAPRRRCAAELRTLAGCVWHIVRRRCGNGIVLTALTAGRLREALAPGAACRPRRARPTTPRAAPGRSSRDAPPPPAPLRDAVAAARGLPRRLALRARRPRARRGGACSCSASRGRSTRATVARAAPRARALPPRRRRCTSTPPRPGAGKWANLNALLAAHPADGYDWLLLVDDDVRLPRGFLDAFLLCAERFGLRLAQPAHAFASHAAWEVTRRRPGLLARTDALRGDRAR